MELPLLPVVDVDNKVSATSLYFSDSAVLVRSYAGLLIYVSNWIPSIIPICWWNGLERGKCGRQVLTLECYVAIGFLRFSASSHVARDYGICNSLARSVVAVIPSGGGCTTFLAAFAVCQYLLSPRSVILRFKCLEEGGRGGESKLLRLSAIQTPLGTSNCATCSLRDNNSA